MTLNPDHRFAWQNRKADFIFYSCLAILLLVIYAPTRNAGFVGDFWGWQNEYDSCELWELWQCANIKSLQHFQHFLIAAFYKIFGLSVWGWTIASISLLLIFLLLLQQFWHKIFALSGQNVPHYTIYAVILLIAIAPFNTEVLVWRVCLHYLLAAIFILLSSIKWLDYLFSGSKKSLLAGMILFIISLGTLEISLVYPLFILPVAWYIFRINPAGIVSFKRRLIILSLISFALITAFFLTSKLVLGTWIGHYGAEAHTSLKIDEFAIHYYQYFAKHLALVRFYPNHIKAGIFELFSNSFLYLIILLAVFGASLLMLRAALRRKFAAEWIGIWGFLVFLLPVGNLYVVYLLLSENDRYGFLAASFLLSALVFLVFRIKNKLRYVLFAVILFANGFYLWKMSTIWSHNGEIYQALVQDFRWYNKEFIFVLNIPENFEGTQMFRTLSANSGLKFSLNSARKRPFNGTIKEVAMYNLMHKANGVTANWVDEQTIFVEMHEWGSWWWLNGLGLADHSNEYYDFKLEGKGYKLTMKTYPSNAVFIYQDGKKWKELTK